MIKNKLESNPLERLPDSELDVMKVLWNSKQALKTGKIVEILSTEKNWSRSTIQVFLARLEERGFISCQKQGRFKYYIPSIKQEVYYSRETKTFLERFHNSSYKKLIASLVQDKTISKDDIDDIIDIIKHTGGDKNDTDLSQHH